MNAKELAQLLLQFYGDDESRWTQGRYCVTREGYSARPGSDGACGWCVVGALVKLLHPEADYVERDHERLYRPLAEALGFKELACWNDKLSGFWQLKSELQQVVDS